MSIPKLCQNSFSNSINILANERRFLGVKDETFLLTYRTTLDSVSLEFSFYTHLCGFIKRLVKHGMLCDKYLVRYHHQYISLLGKQQELLKFLIQFYIHSPGVLKTPTWILVHRLHKGSEHSIIKYIATELSRIYFWIWRSAQTFIQKLDIDTLRWYNPAKRVLIISTNRSFHESNEQVIAYMTVIWMSLFGRKY